MGKMGFNIINGRVYKELAKRKAITGYNKNGLLFVERL